MEGKYKRNVVGHSRSHSEIMYKTYEARAVLYKHASCQATSDLNCDVIVPIMFCTMFSPSCEASVQVDLPLRTSINVSISAPTSVPSLNTPSKESERIPEDQTVSRKRRVHSKSKAIKERSMKYSRRARDKASPEQALSDSQEFDYASPPSPEQDYIDNDPDNSEFSSDNDVTFWKKVGKCRKQKLQASSAFEFPLKYPPHISSLKYDKSKGSSGSSQILIKSCESQQATLSREGDSKLDEANSSVMEAGGDDDWITDDEVDEEELENIDIEMAFKREYKERRLPRNTKEKNFMCDICGKQYSKHNLLRKHVVRHHKEEDGAKLFPYSCQHCENVYITERQLLHHQKQPPRPCEVCGVIFKCIGLLWPHRRDHNSVCQVCDKAFSGRNSLVQHMKIAHQEKNIPCPKCDKMFSFESFKNQHIAKAHPEKPLPYQCDKCDFSAMKKVSVKIHQKKAHTAKPPQYTCKDCNSKFTCEASYNTHVENHISRRSIVCHLCSQRFISDEEIQVHMKSNHKPSTNKNNEENTLSSPLYNGELQYSCGVCNIIWSDEKQLTQHMQQFHYMDIETPRDIKVEIEHVEAPEASLGSGSGVQAVNNGDSNPQNSDWLIKNEPTTLKFSTGLDCSDGESALLMPATAVPPNINMVDINGVHYHVIKGSQ